MEQKSSIEGTYLSFPLIYLCIPPSPPSPSIIPSPIFPSEKGEDPLGREPILPLNFPRLMFHSCPVYIRPLECWIVLFLTGQCIQKVLSVLRSDKMPPTSFWGLNCSELALSEMCLLLLPLDIQRKNSGSSGGNLWTSTDTELK